MELAHKWCRGEGLEMGAAAHNPFGLPGARNVAPWHEDPEHPDRKDWEFYVSAQLKYCGCYAALDLAGEFTRIPVEDGSQDFAIHSHAIEHDPDIIAAFLEID